MAPYTGGGPFQEQVSMPSEQACCSPYYSVLRFFPLPAERDGFSHHQHCGAQFYGGLGGSSALGLLPRLAAE